ncbi:MAG TPA: hypothetical protein VGP41_09535 [Candidatus Lustribacter sp.]|nr:hypothetical protein [Candidatus Lustribacter sp.]
MANAINATVTLVIVVAIAWRAPSLATAALVFYGLGAVSSSGIVALFAWLPHPLHDVVAGVVVTVFSELPLFALLLFITRFPTLPSTPRARLRMRIGDALFVAAAVAFTLLTIFEPVAFSSWAWAHDALDAAGASAIVVLGLLAYRDTPGEARHRIGWVLVGFIISAVCYVGSNFEQQATGQEFGLVIGQCALPVALAYAVLRHRVIDLGFALNRTVIFGAISIVVLVFVSLIDWLSSKILGEWQLATAAEAVVAVVFGFLLNSFHETIEDWVERTVFRERHRVELRLEERTEALSLADSEVEVDLTLALEVKELLKLVSAAVFRREIGSTTFKRVAAGGWSDTDLAEFEADSPLALRMRTAKRPVYLADLAIDLRMLPGGHTAPVLAVPIAAQRELLGIAFYGSGHDGSAPDPKEIALLVQLAKAAGMAYTIVDAQRWRQRVNDLERLTSRE